MKREPWVLRRDQVDLLRRTVAKGTTDDEFALFLWVAKKHKLDHMTRQLHAVKRWSSALKQEVMTVQIGIDGYRSLAARNRPDYGAVDEPEYEYNPDGSLRLARVRLWKKGFHRPTVAVAFWTEFAPTDLAKPQSFMWVRMPKHMLGKCAEALALRKGYPDLADIYTDEEMAQADDDYSPEGREITVDGRRLSEEKAIQTPEYRKQFQPPKVEPQAAPPLPAKQSDEKLIQGYKEVAWRKGVYAVIQYGGQQYTCWEQELWPYLKAGVGKLAKLGLRTVGKYTNIVEIYSIGEQGFSQIEGKSVPDRQVAQEVKAQPVREHGGGERPTESASGPAPVQPREPGEDEPPEITDDDLPEEWTGPARAEKEQATVWVKFYGKAGSMMATLWGRTDLIADELRKQWGGKENKAEKLWVVPGGWVPYITEHCESQKIRVVEKD